MNCDFNILWFEDEIGWFNASKRAVSELLESHNLKVEIHRKNGGDFDDSLIGNDYDLILMDYKLATDITGEKIIEQIRSHDILTDILFYSSQYKEMLESIKSLSPPIDGIYYTDRDEPEFYDKLESLINKIVRRSEDIVNLRGFVLDHSCDFEVRICLILEMCWVLFTDMQREKLDVFTRKLICKLNDKRIDEYYQILKKDDARLYPAAVKPNSLLAHTEKLKLLEQVLQILSEEYDFEITGKHVDFRNNFVHDFSNYRNPLGHMKGKDDSIRIRGQNVKVDSNLHRQLRATIHEYDYLISVIEEYVTEHMKSDSH